MAKSYYFSVFSTSTWAIFSSLSPPQLGFTDSSLKRAKGLKPGDVCFAYVTGVMRIAGAYEIVGTVSTSVGVNIWGSTKFPVCIEVKPILAFNLDDAPEFLSLAHTQVWYNKLAKKRNWSFAFRNSPRPVKDTDGKNLLAALWELQDNKQLAGTNKEPK